MVRQQVQIDPVAVEAYTRIYGQAGPREIAEGLAWYRELYRYALDLHGYSGVPLERILDVLAITSQRQSLGMNLMVAHDIVLYGDYSRALGDVLDKAQRALDGDPTAVAGPKIQEYRSAIGGNRRATPIDTHMIAIVGTYPDKLSSVQYRVLSASCKAAAALCDFEGREREYQGILWVTWRRMTGAHHHDKMPARRHPAIVPHPFDNALALVQ